MKNLIIVTLALMIPQISQAATSGIDTSSLKVKVYAVWAALDKDCSNPENIFAHTTPSDVDFLALPELGAGNIPDGDYQCIIIKMGDRIKFTPSETSDNANVCVEGTEYTLDVCGASSTSVDLAGTRTSCTAGENTVFLYVSTLATTTGSSDSGNTFEPPTTSRTDHGIQLNGSFKVAGGASGEMIVNANGKVQEEGSNCGMNPPVFGFR